MSDLLEQRVQGEKPESGDLKQLMLNSLTMWRLVKQSPEVARLLEDLRFSVSIETDSASGELPYVVLTSDVPAFRPQDDLISDLIGAVLVNGAHTNAVFRGRIEIDTVETRSSDRNNSAIL